MIDFSSALFPGISFWLDFDCAAVRKAVQKAGEAHHHKITKSFSGAQHFHGLGIYTIFAKSYPFNGCRVLWKKDMLVLIKLLGQRFRYFAYRVYI
eukprot:750415-Pelagomonas_calceolata.AAC.1